MAQRADQVGVAWGETDRTPRRGGEPTSHRAAGSQRELVLKGRAWLPMAINNGKVANFEAG